MVACIDDDNDRNLKIMSAIPTDQPPLERQKWPGKKAAWSPEAQGWGCKRRIQQRWLLDGFEDSGLKAFLARVVLGIVAF